MHALLTTCFRAVGVLVSRSGLGDRSQEAEGMHVRQRHLVSLTTEQREVCRGIMARLDVDIPVRRRASILFHCDALEDQTNPDGKVADAVGVDARTVRRVRTAFAQHGFEKALWGSSLHTEASSKVSPPHEARLLILSATPPPPSYPRWTVRTLADKIQGFADAPPVSRELVRRILIRHKATARVSSSEHERIRRT